MSEQLIEEMRELREENERLRGSQANEDDVMHLMEEVGHTHTTHGLTPSHTTSTQTRMVGRVVTRTSTHADSMPLFGHSRSLR